MKNPRVRLAALAAAALLVLSIPPLAFLAWVRGVSRTDPACKIPANVDAVAVVRSLPEAAGPLAKLTGIDLSPLRSTTFGTFGGAAVGVRGRDLVLAVELPRLARFAPVDLSLVDALHIRKKAGGILELGGRRVWIASRGNWAWVATEPRLLDDAVACAGNRTEFAEGVPAVRFTDRALVERLDRDIDAGRLDDLERLAWGRLRAAINPGGSVWGQFDGEALVLRGRGTWVLGGREVAKRAAAAQPGEVSRLAAWSIPGVVLRHGQKFNARALWDDIVHDPENARFVGAFQQEIGEYEAFLGGRKFERDLLPKLGPEREWAIARIDGAAFGIRPKTPIPAVLLAVQVRGIEAEAIKSLDKFLSEAELEGKKMDLPMPKGRTAPVLDPFRHDKVTLDGREVWRVLFREGVSEFGPEFSPGYAVIDGTLWVSSFWPLLTKIAPAVPAGPPRHAGGALDGREALALARDLAGEFAEMQATWALLDRVAGRAADDFAEAYGTSQSPTDAYIRAFSSLEEGLARERPDLKGDAFDAELEERLKAWEAGEKRAFAARRADDLKREPSFKDDVALHRASIEGKLELLSGLGRVEWRLQREMIGHEERDEWEARISPAH